ncbi:hypothetical protein AGRO_1633 [Agrobacterium sp. ATCC 31749]|nr:hypothetical protein AGRO_1633 [Agrobacterium sp. ATCC 31749]
MTRIDIQHGVPVSGLSSRSHGRGFVPQGAKISMRLGGFTGKLQRNSARRQSDCRENRNGR